MSAVLTMRNDPSYYFMHATHNFGTVNNCLEGATCVDCLQIFPHGQKYKCVLRELTVKCPNCKNDAVVPNSSIPDQETLKKWPRLGFETYRGQDGTRFDAYTGQICDSNGQVVPSEKFEYNDDTVKDTNDVYITPDGYGVINEYYGYLNDKCIIYRELSTDGENFFMKKYFINNERELVEMEENEESE